MKEWTPKQRLVLAVNPVWSGPRPEFKEIHILPIEDAKTAELAFQAGDLDYTDISLSSLSTLKKAPPAGARFEEKPSLAYVWLGLNTAHPKLSDLRVRQAIKQAVDIEEVLDAAYFGVAKPANGIIAPGLLGHRDVPPPARDIEGAKRLLAEAQVTHLALTLDVLNTTEMIAAAQVVQANLAEAGIQVTINSRDGGTFWSLGDEKAGDAWKEVQLIINRFTMAPDPSWATEWFICDQVGVWNWERWCNEEFSRLHEEAKKERDDTKRAAMYHRMQELMDESGAYLFLTHGLSAAMYSDKIVPATDPSGRPRLGLFRRA